MHSDSSTEGRKGLGTLVLLSTWLAGTLILAANPADAIPAFARKEGQDCGFCHTAYPKLNEAGRVYKQNGFRFFGDKGTNVWEETRGIPLSVVAEIEAFIDHSRPSGAGNSPNNAKTVGPDGGIDEVELMGAGTLSNRASFFTEIEFTDGGSPGFGPIFVQINDLHGPQGAANLRIGQFDAGLPFFSQKRRVIRNRYLAFDRMGFLGTNFGAELNGQLFNDPDDENGVVHRYGAGVFRGGTNDSDNQFTKGMGWYSLTWNEVNNLGLIATGGQDQIAGNNFKTAGLAAVAQTELDKWTFTGGYFFEYQNFNSDSTVGGNQQLHNVMAEALYMPNESWVFGARMDWLAETQRKRNKDWGLRASALARYNVVSNIWLGGEYRIEDGGTGSKKFGSPVTGDDTTQKGRLFVFFAY